jgi:hypothetical protein
MHRRVALVHLLLFLQQQFLVGLLRLLLAGQQRTFMCLQESPDTKNSRLLLQHQQWWRKCCVLHKRVKRTLVNVDENGEKKTARRG